jgi:hypothetical protein
MTSERHRGAAVLVAAGTLIIASIFLYSIRPLVGITFGSGAIVLAVLVHLGVLAAIVGPVMARRRRRRR